MQSGVCSVDERGDIRQRVLDDAARLPGHRGLSRDADQHQRIHPVPLHSQAAGNATRPVLSARASLHAGRGHEQRTSGTLALQAVQCRDVVSVSTSRSRDGLETVFGKQVHGKTSKVGKNVHGNIVH